MHLRKLCVLLSWPLLLIHQAHAQETTAWENQVKGHITTTKPGTIHYEVGYSSAGFDHFHSEIMVMWNDHGEHEQILYAGIDDKPPAKIWGSGPHICIAMQTCPRYSDHCRQQIIAYRYESKKKSFAELKSSRGLCRTAH